MSLTERVFKYCGTGFQPVDAPAQCLLHIGRLGLLSLMILFLFPACVRRTMTITTEPPNARIFLNDQEIGRSEVNTDFLWYGDYDIVIRKEGYETLKTHWQIDPPWYEQIPLDFFSECLWPGQIHDQHVAHYILHESQIPPTEEVVKRAEELRQQVTEPGP
ncbi:MAG: PEGA domain-containing protein [Planctomycetes bacterium]|nr:PEGA domain-containing protein [Planctomycetota bacterium]MBI3834792.1 PEGA domain-containing protein [Planctomycetota bacterium]